MNLSYNTHFASKRLDGRLTSSLAAHMEQMRRTKPLLALPEEISPEEFPVWKNKVCEKIRELLLLPEFSEQPSPVRLSRVQRDGYAVEKWEMYPDSVSVVPFLVLIPDGADAAHPAPGVICISGSFVPRRPLYPSFEEML